MMNQQPDNFFREKLADYHKPAPVGAWDKIALSLKKTETKFAWWKVAASLLLLAAVAYVLWLQTPSSNTQPISQTKPEIELPRAKSIVPEIESAVKSLNSQGSKNRPSFSCNGQRQKIIQGAPGS
jgi:hypothetical protein